MLLAREDDVGREADGGVCLFTIETIGIKFGDQQSTARGVYIFNFVIMTPVLFLFLLDQPHDCFKCFGKDPDRIFSSYQLTLEEKARRKMVAKFSKKSILGKDHDSVLVNAVLNESRNIHGSSDINIASILNNSRDDYVNYQKR